MERMLRVLAISTSFAGVDAYRVNHNHQIVATQSAVDTQTQGEAGCDITGLNLRNAWTLVRQRRACMAPVLAEKRTTNEPDSFIPSVFSRLYASPSTPDVEDLELGPYTGQGKILVYTTSKYLLETVNGVFFNTGHHTSEMLLPLYHLARAGFDQFDFVTMDGLPVALEEWTFPLATASRGFPAFEDKLRATAATHREAMNSPKKPSDIPSDLSGYLGIFIPGGHGPLIEMGTDRALGAFLRQAHTMELPVMTLCHGPAALRSAALGGEFPFSGYKLTLFPDSTDDSSPGFGYLPDLLKPEDHIGVALTELGMEIMNDDMDTSVYKDRELVTGASNLAAQNFAELAIVTLLAKYQPGASLASLSQGVQKAAEAGCDTTPTAACWAPVLAEKRTANEPDSFIPSVLSRLYASPSTPDVEDLELGPYTGRGKILVYTTSKYLLETVNGVFFNTGHHTSEMLLPLYHLARAGFDQFDFVTTDGLPVALEEWTFPLATASNGFPAFEDKLRATAATHREAMNSPKRPSDIPSDLSGYLGIFIPGGHGPLIEMGTDRALGAFLRQAHTMELPVMTLCHGPAALRSAALGGEFPFIGYKLTAFPDSTDDSSPGFGYLPDLLKPEDHIGVALTELGMEIMNDDMDTSVYKDRELITGASNLAAQNFAELAITSLLAKYQN